uniref:Uncharacterized protein n=1 Tax=Rhizophora mucronata TaxID=61149 RepID=A0A2P2NCR4_RHIMU
MNRLCSLHLCLDIMGRERKNKRNNHRTTKKEEISQ